MAAIQDTFFISHGSPTLTIDESIPARSFLQSWKEKVLPQRPKAILVISAHWDTPFPSVNIVDQNDTIHDFDGFHGFPESLYKLKYPAPGSPDLATKVKSLLNASGFDRVDEDRTRGLDHGAWSPLLLMYPEADIPVCQLSISSDQDGTYHYNLGKALSPLKSEGVLIFGSGNATHNIQSMAPRGSPVPGWISEFDTWLKNTLLEGRYDDINCFEQKAPYAKQAHPLPDHYFPLNVAIGAAGENAKAKLIHHSWDRGTVSYASYQFTTVPDQTN